MILTTSICSICKSKRDSTASDKCTKYPSNLMLQTLAGGSVISDEKHEVYEKRANPHRSLSVLLYLLITFNWHMSQACLKNREHRTNESINTLQNKWNRRDIRDPNNLFWAFSSTKPNRHRTLDSVEYFVSPFWT